MTILLKKKKKMAKNSQFKLWDLQKSPNVAIIDGNDKNV